MSISRRMPRPDADPHLIPKPKANAHSGCRFRGHYYQQTDTTRAPGGGTAWQRPAAARRPAARGRRRGQVASVSTGATTALCASGSSAPRVALNNAAADSIDLLRLVSECVCWLAVITAYGLEDEIRQRGHRHQRRRPQLSTKQMSVPELCTRYSETFFISYSSYSISFIV